MWYCVHTALNQRFAYMNWSHNLIASGLKLFLCCQVGYLVYGKTASFLVYYELLHYFDAMLFR